LRQNEQVYLIGFGSFVQRNRPERQGKNPQTVEASNSVGFKPGKTLKEAVNT
jgi:DNA-binding protein HU-alpha